VNGWTYRNQASTAAVSPVPLRRVVQTPAVSLIEVHGEHAREGDLESRLLPVLADVFNEASVDGWDGEGAAALTSRTYDSARVFLRFVPDIFPAPHVAAYPGDRIGFEWRAGSRRFCVVLVDSGGRLTYSAVFGETRDRGVIEKLDAAGRAVVLANLSRLLA